MNQDTLRFLLREAVRETVTEVLQTVLELDRTAFLQAHGGRRNGLYHKGRKPLPLSAPVAVP
jgi:putative transposase